MILFYMGFVLLSAITWNGVDKIESRMKQSNHCYKIREVCKEKMISPTEK